MWMPPLVDPVGATHQSVSRSAHCAQTLLGLRSGIPMTSQGKWKDGSETPAHQQEGLQRGVQKSITMVKLVGGILRHNHWGWAHLVEICERPNLRGQHLQHIAQKVPK